MTDRPPLTDIAARVEEAWAAHVHHEKHSEPPASRSYTWASGWHPCRRAMALDLIHPEDKTYGADAYERFVQGDDFERAVRAHLTHAGALSDPPYTLTAGQERFAFTDDAGRVYLSGKIEGELDFGRAYEPVPFEIKSGVTVAGIRTLNDFERSPWTRPYPRQLGAYMRAKGRSRGLFVLRQPGRPHFVPLVMGPEETAMVDAFLEAARLARAARAGEVPLPDFTENLTDCLRCHHRGKSCAPPIDFGAGLEAIDDPELVEAARVVVELGDAHREYERARRALSSVLRGRPIVNLGGEYEAVGRWSSYTRYDVPGEVRDRYKVIDPEGRWLMEVQRIGGEREGGGEP